MFVLFWFAVWETTNRTDVRRTNGRTNVRNHRINPKYMNKVLTKYLNYEHCYFFNELIFLKL